jgi:serine/threonine protein kinase
MRSYAEGDEPVPGYHLSRFLGRGGFGEVWAASGPGRVDVAIKIISLGDNQGLKEFRAVRLVKQLRHPNLVPIYAFWLRDEFGNTLDDTGEDSVLLRGRSTELVLAMGLGEMSLAQRLEECQREGLAGIPLAELLDYVDGAARAIDYLNQPIHTLNSGAPAAIQHCDIKPGNILVVGGGVQVCDYGLARALTTDARTTRASGTPAYCAPELFGNRPSAWTDQYSLAISYYELRTGVLPFDEGEAIAAHMTGNLDFSKLPPAERDVVIRATKPRPDQRYPKTLDMVHALRKAAVRKRSKTGPPPADAPPKSKSAPPLSPAVDRTVSARDLPKTSGPREAGRTPSGEEAAPVAEVVLPGSKPSIDPRAGTPPPADSERTARPDSGQPAPPAADPGRSSQPAAHGETARSSRPHSPSSSPSVRETMYQPAPVAASLDELIRVGVELVPGFKLAKMLGRGGYGEVWEAKGPGGLPAALKVVRNLDAVQGKQEFRSLKLIRELEHDHLIKLQAYWVLDANGAPIPDDEIEQPGAPAPNALVIATDLAARNLLQYLQEVQATGEVGIPVKELLVYSRQAADAIDYLNGQGIQHRDIKPENILLTKGRRVKVSDFGLAKLVEGTSSAIHSVSVGLTLAYAAPEMFHNTVSRWTDQYCLAITYYKLRTGQLPFAPDLGPIQMMQAHAEGRLDFGLVGDAEAAVLQQATALEPDGRFATCLEMVDCLEASLGLSRPTLPPGTSMGNLSMPDAGSGPRPTIRPANVTGRGHAAKSPAVQTLRPAAAGQDSRESTHTVAVPRIDAVSAPKPSPEQTGAWDIRYHPAHHKETPPAQGVETTGPPPVLMPPAAPSAPPPGDRKVGTAPAKSGVGLAVAAGVLIVAGLAAGSGYLAYNAGLLGGKTSTSMAEGTAKTTEKVEPKATEKVEPKVIEKVEPNSNNGKPSGAEKVEPGLPSVEAIEGQVRQLLALMNDDGFTRAERKIQELDADRQREPRERLTAELNAAKKQRAVAAYAAADQLAGQQIDAGNYADAARALAEADKWVDGDGAKARHLTALRAVLSAREASGDGETATAVTKVQQSLREADTSSADLAALGRAYADLANRQPGLRGEARQVLDPKLLARLPDDDAKAIRDRFGDWDRMESKSLGQQVQEPLDSFDRMLAPGAALDRNRLALLLKTVDAVGPKIDTLPNAKELRKRVENLRAVAAASDPATAAQGRARMKALLLANDAPANPARLCRAFLQLFGDRPDVLDDTRAVVAKTKGRRDNVFDGDRKSLDAEFQKLVATQIKARLDEAAPNWTQLLALCGEAPADPQAQAAMVECLYVLRNGNPTDAELDKVRAAPDLIADGAGHYGDFARGLAYAADRQPDRAAGELLKAFEGDVPATLKVPRRRELAADVFRKAAETKRQTRTFLDSPYPDAQKEQVFAWLKKAAELSEKGTDPVLQARLAMAAGQAGDAETARKAAAAVRPEAYDGLKDDLLPFLAVKARTTEGEAKQLPAYADLLDRVVLKYKDMADEDQQADYARQILEAAKPAETLIGRLRVGKQSDAELRRAAARVEAARGRVLNENPGDFEGAPAQALEAYNRAIELTEPAPAEFFVGRGFARFMSIFLSTSPEAKKDWPKVEADAQEAKTREPNYYETFQLLAVVRHFEDRLGIPADLRTPGDPLTKGKEAAAYYKLAIDKCKGDSAKERFKPTLLYNRSQFLIGFVSREVRAKDEKAKYLNEAVADAADAIRSDFKNVQKAYDAKGCALEDLGWLVGDATKFDLAIKEMQQAVDVTRRKGYKDAAKDIAKYRMDLGRCQYRAAEFGRKGEKLYKEAADNLDAATRGQASDADRDEANYWLGRAKWALGETEDAEAAFQAVKTKKSRLLKVLALADYSGLLIEQAERAVRAKQSPAATLIKLQVVANDLDGLKEDPGLRGVPGLAATYLRGRIAEYERKPTDADAAYQKVLEECKTRKIANETVYVQSAAAWLRLRLDERWQQDVERLKPELLAGWAKVIKDYLDKYPWVMGAKASASTYAVAAQAFDAAVADERADVRLREAAHDCLEKAARLTPVGDLDGVRLRLRLAEQTAKLLADHPAYRDPALRFLKEVEDGAPSQREKNEAKELAKQLAAKK